MKFYVESCEPADVLRGDLIYFERDFSFDFIRAATGPVTAIGPIGGASLLLSTLSVEIDPATGRLLFPWGLNPRSSWEHATLGVPGWVDGRVFAHYGPGFDGGISLRAPGKDDWRTSADVDSGWICVRRPRGKADVLRIRVCDSALVGIRNSRLNSVWLHPRFEP